MKRARLLVCGVVALASGCLLPYAYPKLDYVPGTGVGADGPVVHAFRVDATLDQIDIGEQGTFKLRAIGPLEKGRLPGQFGASLERGYYVAGGAINYNVGRRHDTRVRLYREGYELVEIPAWGWPGSIVWTRATDLAAQEKAVDDLVRPPKGAERMKTVTQHSDEEPAAHFVKWEYNRLAALATNKADADRLKGKAHDICIVMPMSLDGWPWSMIRFP